MTSFKEQCDALRPKSVWESSDYTPDLMEVMAQSPDNSYSQERYDEALNTLMDTPNWEFLNHDEKNSLFMHYYRDGIQSASRIGSYLRNGQIGKALSMTVPSLAQPSPQPLSTPTPSPSTLSSSEDIESSGNEFEQGGDLNLFEIGGDTETPQTQKTGTVSWNPLKPFNRHYHGTAIYDSPEFSKAFRQAKNDGEERFVWNNEVYSTELEKDPLVEAARTWDTQGDLAKEDFRMQVIRTPREVESYYRGRAKAADPRERVRESYLSSYDLDKLYKAGTGPYDKRRDNGLSGLVISRNTNWKRYDELAKAIDSSELSYAQKLALLANSYRETGGWTALEQYGDGPASGYFMMEPAEKKMYSKWLSDNGRTDSVGSQVAYVVDKMNRKDSSLSTPYSRISDEQRAVVDTLESERDARKASLRSAWAHKGYTDEQAWEDWGSDNVDATIRAFEGLFERAGVPALEERQRMGALLAKKFLDSSKAAGGQLNLFQGGGPVRTPEEWIQLIDSGQASLSDIHDMRTYNIVQGELLGARPVREGMNRAAKDVAKGAAVIGGVLVGAEALPLVLQSPILTKYLADQALASSVNASISAVTPYLAEKVHPDTSSPGWIVKAANKAEPVISLWDSAIDTAERIPVLKTLIDNNKVLSAINTTADVLDLAIDGIQGVDAVRRKDIEGVADTVKDISSDQLGGSKAMYNWNKFYKDWFKKE